MAGRKNTTKRRYHSSNATSGNLARELNSKELQRRLESSGQMDFDQHYRYREETYADRRSRQRAKAKSAIRPAQKVSPLAIAGFACVAALLIGLVMCQVQLNTISSDIVKMKEQIYQLEDEQLSLRTRYEQAFDLTSVKEAAEEAGMTTPNDSQIYYIALPGEDQAVAYAPENDGGLAGILSNLKQSFSAVLEYFR